MRVLFVLASVCSLSLAGCSASVTPLPSEAARGGPSRAPAIAPSAAPRSLAATEAKIPIKYVALGDSYTIGTSVKPRERWPNQLSRTLSAAVDLDLVDNLAVNGATSADVIDDQVDQLPDLAPDFVSLLIGVNDAVHNVDLDAYSSNLHRIVNSMLAEVPANRILLVTTPNYTLTPQGSMYGEPTRNAGRIRAFNEAMVKEGLLMQILVVDISSVADSVPKDRSLVADDGLHPSGKQYAGWVELMAPPVRKLLRTGTTP